MKNKQVDGILAPEEVQGKITEPYNFKAVATFLVLLALCLIALIVSN